MKVYVAIWADRHTDTTVHVFTNSAHAIEWASDTVKEYCRCPEDLDETFVDEQDVDRAWLYYGVYSCEGDNIRVIECTVNAEPHRKDGS